MLAWLIRYGPKSVDELLRKTVRFNQELQDEIAELMREEKAAFDAQMDGDT